MFIQDNKRDCRDMKTAMNAIRYGTVALLITITWGCASSERSATIDVHVPPTPVIDISRYENFDPSPYPDAPLDTLATVAHDVPTHLMEGRAAEGLQSEVPGFRVQIFSSIERNAAMEAQENVQVWWRKQHDEGAVPEEIFPEGLPVYNVYSQPYYRIRVGDFLSREEARILHSVLAQHFTDAFIVPDTIVITR